MRRSSSIEYLENSLACFSPTSFALPYWRYKLNSDLNFNQEDKILTLMGENDSKGASNFFSTAGS